MVLRSRNDDLVLQQGYRKVSNTSYMSASSLDSQATVLIPEYPKSQETLKFLEFNDLTSEQMWAHFFPTQSAVS